eukprot:TRINITY_DN85076_c0_g1_i1.p1 TRINITY_DN85076_c0_g1~~TRINITY_DN85076_c0_g1_i1.p1  ORF type:complete len:344 (-),score=25.82 TRINITY_DN85076_c0_g1_i1:79-1110(-)
MSVSGSNGWLLLPVLLATFVAYLVLRKPRNSDEVLHSHTHRAIHRTSSVDTLLLSEPWKIEDKRVFVDSALVFELDGNGTMKLPSSVTHVGIEVGLDKSSELLPLLQHDPTLFVFAFEPMAERFWKANKAAKEQSRFRLVPAAVSPAQGHLQFSYLGGCSSVESISSDTSLVAQLQKARKDLGACVGVGKVKARVLTVGAVALQPLLSAIPPSVDVDLLKIDAQGHDMRVVLSCGKTISRVKRVMAEAQDIPMDHWGKLYPTALNTTLLHTFMAEHDFELLCCRSNNAVVWEVDCFYVRSQFKNDGFKFPESDDFGKQYGSGFYDKVTGDQTATDQASYPKCS